MGGGEVTEISDRLRTALSGGQFDGDGPEPAELEYYLNHLLETAPDEYEPWLFRCRKESKAPETKFGSWKDESNRLSPSEAIDAMRSGWNIGIAGTPDDGLVNVDIDDDDATDIDEIKPTLRSRSRSRSGRHAQYFAPSPDEIPNIPTSDKGEVRTNWQYVLAPGSFVPTDPDEEGIEGEQRDLAGYYTVEVAREPSQIEYDELPDVFKDAYEAAQAAEEETYETDDYEPPEDSDGGRSAVFNINVRDIVKKEGGSTDPSDRWSAIFHGSDTDANMSVSNKGRLHCWRHLVAHGGLQVLAVLSGETQSGEHACKHIGKGHKNSGSGPSRLRGGELVWPAWKYAKSNSYLPSDDKIPHSALQHLAIDHGLVESDEITDGWKLPDEVFNETLELVESEYGLDTGREPLTVAGDLDAETVADHAHVIDDRREYHDVENPAEDIVLPDGRSYVLIKPPRAGGSYAIQSDFVDQSKPFMVLAPRHEILKYHVETVSELIGNNHSIVHLMGKSHNCESAGACDKIPEDYGEYQDAIDKITSVVNETHIITADDAPFGLCKHWFLKNAARFADVVLTVPQIAIQIDRDFGGMNLFIDEEDCFDPFHPGSADLVSYGTQPDTDGKSEIQIRSAQILKEIEKLTRIKRRIDEDQKERARQGTTNKYRVTGPEKHVLEAIETIERIADVLGINEIKREILSNGETPTIAETKEKQQEKLESIEFPDVEMEPDKLREAINEYCAPYFYDDETNPSELLTAVLFPYKDKPFHFKTVAGETTCRLVGDREQIFYADWFSDFDQVAAVAGPEGERFLQSVRDDPMAVEIKDFPYADQFVVIPIGKHIEEDTMEPRDEARRRVDRTAELLNAKPFPFLLTSGTKKEAKQKNANLTHGASTVLEKPKIPAKELYKMWTTAQSVVIYENSVISKGIDAPPFDVTLIGSTGYATPYYEVKQEVHDPDSDEYKEALAIEQEKKTIELTNIALRMSHTYDTSRLLGTKFILASPQDVERIKYLDERVTPKLTYADQAADFLSLLAAQGQVEAQMEAQFNELNRSQKAFTEVALEYEFKESAVKRPEYTIEEVSEWIESGYLKSDVIERVTNAVENSNGNPTTSEINRKVPGLNGKRVKSILTILERKGKLFSMTGESSGGRPPTVWEVTESNNEA